MAAVRRDFIVDDSVLLDPLEVNETHASEEEEEEEEIGVAAEQVR